MRVRYGVRGWFVEDSLRHGVPEQASEGLDGQKGGPGDFFVSRGAGERDELVDAEAVDCVVRDEVGWLC